MHVKYMHVLSQALENAGGRAPSCTLTSSEHQDTVYNAWCKGKIGALKELSIIENMAAQEAEWSARHPEEGHENVQTASKALDLYWAETTGRIDEPPRPKRDSAVAFAEDTDFEPGRPNPYFHRRSPRYEPGKYTVVDDDGDDHDAAAHIGKLRRRRVSSSLARTELFSTLALYKDYHHDVEPHATTSLYRRSTSFAKGGGAYERGSSKDTRPVQG